MRGKECSGDRKNRGKRAFTLIEVVVTLAVLGIVSAIATPNYLNLTGTAEEKADHSSLATLNKATAHYRAVNQEEDPFSASEDAVYLMEVLVPEYLDQKAVPQQADKSFVWSLDQEEWALAEAPAAIPYTPAAYFTLNAEGNMITGYDGSGGTDLNIAGEFGGTALSVIGHGAFDNKDSADKLTSVTLPDSLTKIKGLAFRGNSLTEVAVPGGVDDIGVLAFEGNTISDLTIGEGVKTIGEWAFANNDLTSVVLPESLENLDNYAFTNNDIRELTIGADVEIEEHAFHQYQGETGLKSFNEAYENNGRQAGTYVYADGQWAVQ